MSMPGELYLLDTDICSYLMSPHHDALRIRFLATDPDLRTTSVIVHAEIWYGLESKHVGLRRRMAARTFLQSLRVLDWTAAAAQAYGDLRANLERRGRPIGDHDIMIAAHVLSLDAILVTNNTRHFRDIGFPLRLENWTA